MAIFERLKTAWPAGLVGGLFAVLAAVPSVKDGIAVFTCDGLDVFDVAVAARPTMCATNPPSGAELTWILPAIVFITVVGAISVFIFRRPQSNESSDGLSTQDIQEQIEVLRTRRDAGHISDANAERLARLEDAFEARTLEALERAVGIDESSDEQKADTSDARRAAVKDAIEDGDTNEREAMARIASGDIQGGLNLLESEADTATIEAIEMWRRVGLLADGIDTTRALNAFAKAVALGSDDVWDSIYLCRLQTRAGDLKAAKVTFKKAFGALPESKRRDRSVLQHELGNILKAEGDFVGARRSYNASLETRKALATRDPTNPEWQYDMSVSHKNIGDILREQNDLAGARRSYELALEIGEVLTVSDPANPEWQRDVSTSHIKIGDILKDENDLAGARRSYDASLEILKSLAANDPANSDWQRSLSVSHHKIGDILEAQSDIAGALRSYEKCFEIIESLAARDPANAV